MNSHRQRITELLTQIRARHLATDETAQGYNGGSGDSERMYNMYMDRAQGQYDIYKMVEQFISDLDSTDGWPQ